MPRSVKIFFHVKANTAAIRPDVFPRIVTFIKDQNQNSPVDFYFIADSTSEIQKATVRQVTRQLLANSNIAVNFISAIATPFDLIIGRLGPAHLRKIVTNFEDNPAQAARQYQALINRLSHKPLNNFGDNVYFNQINTVEFLLRALCALPSTKEILPLGLLYAAMMFSECDSSTLVISDELEVIFSCFIARIKFLQDKHQKIKLLGLHVGHGTALYRESDWLQVQELRTEASLISLIEQAVATSDRNFYGYSGRRGDLIKQFNLPAYSGGETTESFKRDVPRNRLVGLAEIDESRWLQVMQRIQANSNDYSQGDFTGSSDVGLMWNRLVLNFVNPTQFALALKPSSTFFSFLDQQQNPTGISIWKWHENLWMIAIVRYPNSAECFSDAQVKIFFNGSVKHMMSALLKDQLPSCQIFPECETLLQNISETISSAPHMALLNRQLFTNTTNSLLPSIALFSLERAVSDFLGEQKEDKSGVVQIDAVGLYPNNFAHKLVIAMQSDKQGRTFLGFISSTTIVDMQSHMHEQQLLLEVQQRIQLFKFLLDNQNKASSSSTSSSSIVDESGIAPEDKTFLTENFQKQDKDAQITLFKILNKKIADLIESMGFDNLDTHHSGVYQECAERYRRLSFANLPRMRERRPKSAPDLESKASSAVVESSLRQSESVIESLPNATPTEFTI